MKIVGVSGGSGAGKTTVSRGLAEKLPNAIFIDADPFFREATEKLEDEVFNKIGMVKEEGVLSQNYFFYSKETMDGWIDVVKDYVSSRIGEAVTKLGAGKDFVIVDWCYLPMCDYFFNCDMTLCVKADYETRYERLANRMKAVAGYSIATGPSFYEYNPEAFANRVKYSAIDEYGYQSDYVILNDRDMDTLNKMVSKIAVNLMEMSDPNRNITQIRKSKKIPEFARPIPKKPITESRKEDVVTIPSKRIYLPTQSTRGSVFGNLVETR